jgi:hypothetical protein
VIEGKLVNVAGSVAHRVALDLKVENANNEENVLYVRRENVLQEESDQPKVAKEPRVRHVYKGSVLRVRQGNGPLDPSELKALPRKLQ